MTIIFGTNIQKHRAYRYMVVPTHLNCEWSWRRNTGVDYTYTTTLPERPYLGHWESTHKYTQVKRKSISNRLACTLDRIQIRLDFGTGDPESLANSERTCFKVKINRSPNI